MNLELCALLLPYFANDGDHVIPEPTLPNEIRTCVSTAFRVIYAYIGDIKRVFTPITQYVLSARVTRVEGKLEFRCGCIS